MKYTPEEIHREQVELGWWPEGVDVAMKRVLIVREISEAVEALRKDKMDDHLPHRKGEEVELADAVIRLLDYMGYKNVTLDCDYCMPTASMVLDPKTTDGELYEMILIEVKDCWFHDAIKLILTLCGLRGYDLEGAMTEKLEYNRHRADHKKAAREAEGGKKF